MSELPIPRRDIGYELIRELTTGSVTDEAELEREFISRRLRLSTRINDLLKETGSSWRCRDARTYGNAAIQEWRNVALGGILGYGPDAAVIEIKFPGAKSSGGRYAVTRSGVVLNVQTGRKILAQPCGRFLSVYLPRYLYEESSDPIRRKVEGRAKRVYMHDLVLQAYHGERPEPEIVTGMDLGEDGIQAPYRFEREYLPTYIDGDPNNLRCTNLAWRVMGDPGLQFIGKERKELRVSGSSIDLQWKTVYHNSQYEVSEMGDLRKKSTRLLIAQRQRSGGPQAGVMEARLVSSFLESGIAGTPSYEAVKDIVWETYIGSIPDGHIVWFKNGDLGDHRLSNLDLLNVALWNRIVAFPGTYVYAGGQWTKIE